MEWADIVTSVPIDELGGDIHEHCRLYSNEELALLPYSTRVRAPHTHWPQWVPRNVPPEGFVPSSVHDVYKPWSYDVRKDWYKRHGSDLREMIKNPSGYKRKHRDTVVLGESAFHEEAYGTVWETCEPCVQWPTGWRPMDPDEELDMFLNYDYFAQEMPDYDDQELLWMLKHGATMKAYLPYQTVLVPHLLSLKNQNLLYLFYLYTFF